MNLTAAQREFLESAEAVCSPYNAIRTSAETELLYHPFWSFAEIQSVEEIKADWEVPGHWVPFYGDCHDLFCLDLRSGEVVSLNDEREVLCTWSGTAEFLEGLTIVEDEPAGEDGPSAEDEPSARDDSDDTGVWLDPDLLPPD